MRIDVAPTRPDKPVSVPRRPATTPNSTKANPMPVKPLNISSQERAPI